MEIIADLHLHSKYSRAVSSQMVIPEMARWAKLKGINLLGTGDFTHPKWILELRQYLDEEKGILKLKEGGFEGGEAYKDIKFLLTTEISSIYSQGGKTRKIHNLIIAPSFEVVEKINAELKKRGANIASDGRPIVGISAKSIAELVLAIDEKCLIIPAHIWTPWFSMFGEKSGFESVEECFEDYAKYIYAVETGLSSDPKMNWAVENLNKRQIVSFSDAHSPAKLGRELTVIEVKEINYEGIVGAIKGDGDNKIKYTVEFYPEEGKYHYTGHRNCKVVQSPKETAIKGSTCPVCGKMLTGGVMEQVRKLGSLEELEKEEVSSIDKVGVNWISKEGRPSFVRLVPLLEIVAESKGSGTASKSVQEAYQKVLGGLGNELAVLLRKSKEEITDIGGEKLAEGILKVRSGTIFIEPGFDGEFGKVKVWRGAEDLEDMDSKTDQLGLF